MPLIRPEWEEELYAYIAGLITNLGGHSLEINGISDHIHLLLRLDARLAFADVMRELRRVPRVGCERTTMQNSPGSEDTAHSR